MTLLQRAATIAAVCFSLAGSLGTSTPGWASGLDRTPITGVAAVNNRLTAVSVPQAAEPMPAVATDTRSTTDPVSAASLPATHEADDQDASASYATLAEAVAHQDAGASDDDVRCLAGAVYFESKGEPLAGQLAVAEVIMNRAKSGRFPSSVCSVVTQHGQFSFVRNGIIPAIDGGRAAYRTAIAVAKVALAQAWNSQAPKALFFNTPGRLPGGRLTRIAAIGNHVFYR